MSATQSEVRPQGKDNSSAKRPPQWMSMPGAPARPNFAEFGSKISQMNAEKHKYIDMIKTLQSSIQGSGANRSELDIEREGIRQKIKEVDAQRRTHAQLRSGKNTEIAKIRQQRRDAADKLRELQADLGGMKDVREIDAAISYVMKKMETSGGGLSAEKRTVKRLHQLEEAKELLIQLQPLGERMQEAEEREVLLQQEYREIHEHIGVLNREFDQQLRVAREKDQEARSTGSDRAEVYEKCDKIRVQIHALDEEMNRMRAEHSKVAEAWGAWCVDARAKYQAKIESQREERQRAIVEQRNATKNAEKLARAQLHRSRYQLEIDACDTLVQYLLNKKRLTAIEVEERKRREAAASFDPAKAAPSGCVVLKESEWTKAKPLSKAAGKQQQKKQADGKPAGGKGGSRQSQQGHVMQHPEDKMRLFQLVGQAPPLSLFAVDDTIDSLHTKKKEYESHIVTGELHLSSSDSESDQEPEEAHDDNESSHNEQSPDNVGDRDGDAEERDVEGNDEGHQVPSAATALADQNGEENWEVSDITVS